MLIFILLKQQNRIFSKHKKEYVLILQDGSAQYFAEGLSIILIVEY